MLAVLEVWCTSCDVPYPASRHMELQRNHQIPQTRCQGMIVLWFGRDGLGFEMLGYAWTSQNAVAQVGLCGPRAAGLPDCGQRRLLACVFGGHFSDLRCGRTFRERMEDVAPRP